MAWTSGHETNVRVPGPGLKTYTMTSHSKLAKLYTIVNTIWAGYFDVFNTYRFNSALEHGELAKYLTGG